MNMGAANPELVDASSGSRELREGLFDVVTFAAAALMPTTITFFGHTQDVNGPQVTNLSKANELPSGERMEVYSLKIGMQGFIAADFPKIRAAYRAQLIVANKPVLTGPTQKFPFGGNLQAEVTEVGARPFWINDDTLVITIQPGVRFRVELQSSTGFQLSAGSAGDIYVELDGIHSVPIN